MTLTRWAFLRSRSDALPIAPERWLWLLVIAGALTVNAKTLAAHEDSEVLLFDPPPV